MAFCAGGTDRLRGGCGPKSGWQEYAGVARDTQDKGGKTSAIMHARRQVAMMQIVKILVANNLLTMRMNLS